MSNPTFNERAAVFMEKLRKLQNDRGKMASLRRGMTPATVMEAWPIVASIGGEIGMPGESAYLDVAALFASHPVERASGDFGEACQAIALAGASERKIPKSHERRFRRLLACSDAAELSAQVRTWIRLAASKGIGINYQSLFSDLHWWNNSADQIKVRWARSFWYTGGNASPSKPTETSTP